MSKEYLSITELAKIRKVSSETLRYYDRIGLLKPQYIDPETHYRYYTTRQSETLGAIRELRDLGMSIKDIQAYYDDCNLEKTIRLFHEHQLLLQQEAEERLAYCRVISEKLAYLSSLAAMKNYANPTLVHLPERKIITFGVQATNQKEHVYALTQLEWYLNSVAPTLATDRIGVYGGPEMLEESDSYVKSTPMIFAEVSNAEPENTRVIPEGDYLCMAYSNGRLGKYNPIFRLLKEHIQQNGLIISGDIFHIYKIDVTLTQNRAETLLEVQVPVLKG